jgi:hypothetical protein
VARRRLGKYLSPKPKASGFRSRFALDSRHKPTEFSAAMKNTFASLLVGSALALSLSTLHAQEHKRISPHETVNANIDGDQISVVYGRPFTKDPKTGEKRKIWGTLVPFDKVWRMGADEATQLTTAQPIDLGGKQIPAGTYSLFMIPRGDKGASLIVNKQTGQSGTKYDEAQDLVRVEMKPDAIGVPIDQLTISLDKNPGGGGVMKVAWEGMQYSVDIKVAK